MKKNLFLALVAIVSAVFAFTSCNKEDGLSELEKQYFTVDGATYKKGNMPKSTTSDMIQGIFTNPKALQGGMNFITVSSEKAYKRFFIGMKGEEGYFEYIPQTSRAAGYNLYTIPVSYSTSFASNITMLVSAEEESGDITAPYEADITYVESMSGDLNINLTFSTPKDVDLHLYTPSGEHIYYSNRGGSVQTADGYVTYGLDKDSNAGCSIDNLNNENIYIPAEMIESGTYKVVVDMYENCNTDYATSWSVIARYKGQPVQVTSGQNPASGVYDADCGEGDHTTVMTFTLDGNSTRSAVRYNYVPYKMTEMDSLKLDAARYCGREL